MFTLLTVIINLLTCLTYKRSRMYSTKTLSDVWCN